MAALAIANPTPAGKDRAALNRANAAHSTGPRTIEGKDRVRLNALRHGFHSQTVLLPHEDSAAFEALTAQYTAEFDPQTDRERQLVGTLRDAHWRLDRAVALQTNILSVATGDLLDQIDPEIDHEVRLAIAQARAYQANSRVIDQLSRQESRFHRVLQASRRELIDLIALRTPSSLNGFVPLLSSGPVTPPENTYSEMPHFVGPLAEFKRKSWLAKAARRSQAGFNQ